MIVSGVTRTALHDKRSQTQTARLPPCASRSGHAHRDGAALRDHRNAGARRDFQRPHLARSTRRVTSTSPSSKWRANSLGRFREGERCQRPQSANGSRWHCVRAVRHPERGICAQFSAGKSARRRPSLVSTTLHDGTAERVAIAGARGRDRVASPGVPACRALDGGLSFPPRPTWLQRTAASSSGADSGWRRGRI